MASSLLTAAENQLDELAAGIALGEMRLARLQAAQQRLEHEGDDTLVVAHHIRHFGQTVQRWRDEHHTL